jgi:hypothetical protein
MLNLHCSLNVDVGMVRPAPQRQATKPTQSREGQRENPGGLRHSGGGNGCWISGFRLVIAAFATVPPGPDDTLRGTGKM